MVTPKTTTPTKAYVSHTPSLASHGGGCCGMTHVKNFYSPPEYFCHENKSKYPPLPEETATERVARLIRNMEAARGRGIIEAILIQPEKVMWDKILTEVLGFRLVSQNTNSNSNNTIYVYHRLSGAEGVRKIPRVFSYPPKPVAVKEDELAF